MSEDQILAEYGENAGRVILRLLSERDNALRLNEEMTRAARVGSGVWWRTRYFVLFDQLGAIADVVGAPRASNYSTGHVFEAVKHKVLGT